MSEKMSYNNTHGFLVENGTDLIGNLDYSAGSATAAPSNISVIRRNLIDKLYEKKAAEELKTPQEVTEGDLFEILGITDKRSK